jgi:hypothetical protein
MKTDYKNLEALSDKKIRTLRNNLNNRIESFSKGGEKNLPPSHMLHGLDENDCKKLLSDVLTEMKKRGSKTKS